jgi:hypothetical protein
MVTRTAKGGKGKDKAAAKKRRGKASITAPIFIPDVPRVVANQATAVASSTQPPVSSGLSETPRVFSTRTGGTLTEPPIPHVLVPHNTTPSVTTSEYTSAELYEVLRKKGRMGSESMLASDLVSFVRIDLFPKLKFFMDSRQLMFSTAKDSICYQICTDLGLTAMRAAAWWELYKNKIVKTLNSKRADATSAIKRVFMSKFYCGARFAVLSPLLTNCAVGCWIEDVMRALRKKEAVPLLEDILKLSLGGDAYQWVCVKLLKCVVGCSIWNRRYYKELLSEVATDSDESFVVLTIENNYQRWLDEARHHTGIIVGSANPAAEADVDDDAWKENLPPARYTNSGANTSNGRGSNRRCGGWSRAGYLRFNALHGLVKEDRKRRANFELELKEQFAAEHELDDDIDASDDDGEEIIPANDLTGVKQPVALAADDSDDDCSN